MLARLPCCASDEPLTAPVDSVPLPAVNSTIASMVVLSGLDTAPAPKSWMPAESSLPETVPGDVITGSLPVNSTATA